MRRINKSEEVPATLKHTVQPACADDVDHAVYAAEDVKNQLLADQHNKCAYCEKLIEGSYNDVEHYRPKSKYFWLGYEWNNLLYACNICNRTCKNAEFPLRDESVRCLAKQDISAEEPLIVNPAQEDPKDFIVFNQHIAQPKIINGKESDKGKTTIELFKLNERKVIVEARRALYDEYQRALTERHLAEEMMKLLSPGSVIYQKTVSLLQATESDIQSMESVQKPFSGMLLALL